MGGGTNGCLLSYLKKQSGIQKIRLQFWFWEKTPLISQSASCVLINALNAVNL